MSEETIKEKKEEIIYIAGNNPFDQESTLVTNIGSGKGAKEKLEIYWFRPVVVDGNYAEVEAALIEQYGTECNLNFIIDKAIRGMATGPNYHLEYRTDSEGNKTLSDGGHERMQALASEFKVGVRNVSGTSIKAKAKELDSIKDMLKESNMSMEDLMKSIAEIKEMRGEE